MRPVGETGLMQMVCRNGIKVRELPGTPVETVKHPQDCSADIFDAGPASPKLEEDATACAGLAFGTCSSSIVAVF